MNQKTNKNFIIKVKKLNYDILENINFGLKPRKVLHVIGNNCSGKSVLVNALSYSNRFKGHVYMQDK